MERNPLLDSYLRQLRLPTFTKLYPQFATDAARNNQDTVRFLLALAEQEVNQRQLNMLQQRLKTARFPVLKELADFDFSCLPLLNKAQILDLAVWRIHSTKTEFDLDRKSWAREDPSSVGIGCDCLS